MCVRIGISESAQKRLFTSFSQAHREINGRYGGTGLGLAISKSLVELFGGNIGLRSAPGEGSCFFFQLNVTGTKVTDIPTAQLPNYLRPLLVQEVTTPAPSLAPLSAATTVFGTSLSPMPRVLLVHHNVQVSALMSTMLSEWGLKVTVALSFESFKAEWAAADAVINFHCIMYDVASIYSIGDQAYLAELHRITRRCALTIGSC